MSKFLIYLFITVAVIGLSATSYVYFGKEELVTVASPSKEWAAAPEGGEPKRGKPNHGDFEKRFEPTPPPANGGKL